ncbi:MAG: substrate-binding domain-containing protein, partial [Lactobacillus iners]|nr:substrate-binding domain-containing protein [Lactobacillus iners]
EMCIRDSINRGCRIKSYRQFLADHGIKSEYIYDNILTFEDGYNLFAKLHSDGIDAVVTTKDITAAGIVNAALDSQVSIPEQFEIISATSTNIAKIVRPQLTSIQQPLYDIGAVAMRMLTKLMKNEDVAEKNIVLPYQILKHNTTLNK